MYTSNVIEGSRVFCQNMIISQELKITKAWTDPAMLNGAWLSYHPIIQRTDLKQPL